MPRYKDSPEVRAAKQERREKLRELLTLMESEDVRDLKYVFKEIVRVLYTYHRRRQEVSVQLFIPQESVQMGRSECEHLGLIIGAECRLRDRLQSANSANQKFAVLGQTKIST